MGAKQEAAVLEMLHGWGAAKPDVGKIVEAFSPDAAWTLYMPDGPTIRGRAALHPEIERQLSYCNSFVSHIYNVASSDELVIVERRDEFVRNGIPVKQHIAGIFELNADNQITAYRDYFDLIDFAEQTGADINALSGLEGAASRPRPIPEATATGIAVPAPAPLNAQERFIADFCDAWGDGSSQTKPDVERIVSMMSPDAEWQLWMPGGPVIRGRQALREEILRQTGYATNNKCHIVHAVSSERLVMQERSDWAVINGKPCPHQMIAVYELDEAGLIKRWREYINMADMQRKREAPAPAAAAAS